MLRYFQKGQPFEALFGAGEITARAKQALRVIANSYAEVEAYELDKHKDK